MNLDEARAEVVRILDADLAALTDHGRLSVVPAVAEVDWDLPGVDRRALWTYGLPPERDDDKYGVVGDYQPARDPRLDVEGLPHYSIGRFGEGQLAAAAGSGRVVIVPGFTYDEVHPQLRDRFPDGVIHPALVNSSVALLVDFAWRWHWLLPIVAGQQIRAGVEEQAAWRNARTPAEKAALPDFFAGVRAMCRGVVERFRQLDGEAVADPDSVWCDAVMEYL